MTQTAGSEPEFDGISPVFFVKDAAEALTFYCEHLGFEVGWTWGTPVTHANVCRGRISISLMLDAGRAGSGEAYVELKGVNAYHAELQGRNVTVGELADRVYGMRDFELIDPSGNRLVFGEPTVG